MKNKENKKTRSRALIVIALLSWLILMLCLTLIADGRRVRFYVSGEQEMQIEQGSAYVEPGVYAVSAGRIFGEGDRHLSIRTQGQVDSDTLGSYYIDYEVDSLFGRFSTRRVVHVVDTQAPVIELMYVEGYSPSWIDGYVEEGYRAYDSYDGDLTDKVKTQQLADRIVYSVSDSSGNETVAERPLPDYSATPSLTLVGDEYVEIYAGDSYTDPGCIAIDGLGNDLSGHLLFEGSVDSMRVGEYYLCYSLMGANGEGVSVTRAVNVLPQPLPEISEPAGRTIYLTFDDGPGPYTGRLLDILSAYGVPATFFVTAANPDYYDLIGRAHREGHSIGVHTYTHNYNQIYSSEEAWLEDFWAMQEIIYEQTGEYSSIFRFPGGSSNTVSRFNPGIMSRLAEMMVGLGYRFYDWNVSSGDAGETNDTDEIIENIINGCAARGWSIVLQHDIKDYSVAAVEQLIIWGRNNGYSFRALDLTSPDAHHGINN